MCNAVRFDGRWYNTPAELAELVGGAEKLVWQDLEPSAVHAMDLCLCPIDLAATLSKAGLEWTRGVDPMEWYAAKPSAN
jgi:hypothetical protein